MSHTHGTTPIGPHRAPAEHEQGFSADGTPFIPSIKSPSLTPIIDNPNISYVPDRMDRSAADFVWSGTKAALPSWDTLSTSTVDTLLLPRQGEASEAYNGRLPKRFLRFRSFVVGTQLKVAEVRTGKNDKLEKEAVKMMHAADTITRARRSRGSGAKLIREEDGTITDRTDPKSGDRSAVTSSEYYRAKTRQDGIEPSVVAKSGSESRRVKRMARYNRQRRKYAYEAKNMRRAVELLADKPDSELTKKQIRNRNKNAKVGKHASHIADGYINGRKVAKVVPRKGILDIAHEEAREVKKRNDKVAKAQSKKLALAEALEQKRARREERGEETEPVTATAAAPEATPIEATAATPTAEALPKTPAEKIADGTFVVRLPDGTKEPGWKIAKTGKLLRGDGSKAPGYGLEHPDGRTKRVFADELLSWQEEDPDSDD